MKSKAYDLDKSTPLIPEIVADEVCAKRNIFDSKIVKWMCSRARFHFAQKGVVEGRFRGNLKSSQGREWLACYMNHWLDALIKNPSILKRTYELN